MSQPLVSVVTPFHNTAQYLAQCVESVLAQSYTRFEYILVDNCSTDGSGEIAETYARRDPRIRLIRRPQLLSQVQNYNAALTEISGDSQYCKIVQADDFIFPDCLRLMVEAFEQSESIGLVSSYDLKANTVRGSGFPYPTSMLPGPEMARLCLRTGLFVFGSPTTVMYRSSLVRDQRPFYDESLLHEDTEKCMQILEHWDFGFVHRVLSFLRVADESISAAFRTLQPDALDRYVVVQRYAPRFLAADEARALRKRTKRHYYDLLSHEALRFRGRDFWRYHQGGLKSLDELLDWPYLALRICRKLLGMAANPGSTVLRVLHWLQSKLGGAPSPKLTAAHEETTGVLSAPAGSEPRADDCVNVRASMVSIIRRRYVVILLLFLGALALVLAVAAPVFRVAAIAVDLGTTFQTIDGFGASATGYTGIFTPDQADRFFSSSTGLGLSLLRIRPIAGTADADCDCVSNSTPYSCVLGSKSQIMSGDLQVAQLAAARGVRLLATPWSPPATMKSSGKYCGGGSLIGNSDNYAEYAADLSDFPVLLSGKGLSIYAMSIQNEPDIENSAYDTCKWTAQQIHDFIPYLSNGLKAAGFAGIKIAIPEEAGWTFQRMGLAMNDPVVAEKVGLMLSHGYQAESPSGIPSVNGLHVWQAEVSNSDNYDGSIADAVGWAQYVHNYMSVGANAFMYWSLDCGPKNFNQGNNMCLTDQRSNLAKRAYVLGQYAKFVRPGWRRVGVKNQGPLLVTAYKGPENEFAIVAVNTSRWLPCRQEFVLNGIASRRLQVTPWLTSASASLEIRPKVSLTSDGTAFSYMIPAKSVVTFQGQGD